MSLVFRSKSRRMTVDGETQLLADFLIENPKFIELTFAVMSRIKKSKKDITPRVSTSPEIDTVEEEDLGRYYDMMKRFYDTTDDKLGKRRGTLLELIVGEIGPVNSSSNYKIILESLVEHNNIKISEKDIDVVFEYEEIELIECKSNLKSYLPSENKLPWKKKEKLDFMVRVKSIALDYSINCHLFFATYDQDERYYKEVLYKNNYEIFEIINRERIVKSLCS